MLDPILFRNQLPETAEKLKRLRGFDLDVGHFEHFESERKRLQSRTQELQNLRNTRSKAIGQAKAKGEDVAALMAEVAAYGDELKVSESDLDALTLEMHSAMAVVPNIPHESVPVGRDENENVALKQVGQPPVFDFEIGRAHV